jgi:hypothetical protein
MTIKVTYNVTDVYVTQDVSPVYINVSYSSGGGGGAAVWGGITGTLSDQTDLQTALDGKFDDPTGTTSQYLRGDGSLATFPSLTGYVPYTGATTNVDLGTHRILAQNATFSSSGSGDTVTLNHSSGSGIGLNITKGGNGEGLYINKTSGSGNAATIIGTINATSFVKSGGTSSQFLKADGTVDSSVYVPTSREITINGVTFDLSANRSWAVAGGISGSGAAGQVAYWNGTSAQSGSNNLFWDNANGRLGIGTNTPAAALTINSAATLVTGIRFDNAGSIGTIFGDGTSMNIRSGNTHGIQVNSGSASLVQSIASVGGFRVDLQTLTTSPIYSYNGDGDTGIGRAAADTLTFYAGGEKARIFSTGNLLLQNGGTFTDGGQRLQVQGTTLLNGNVTFSSATGMTWDATNGRLGIGTNAPSELLTVQSSTNAKFLVKASSGFAGFDMERSSNGVADLISFKTSSTFDYAFGTRSGHSDLVFYSYGTNGDVLRLVKSNGNLLLQNGGTFTDSGERLQVTGTMKVTGATNLSSSLTVGSSITANFTDGFALNFGVFNLKAAGSRIQYETTYQSGHYFINNGASATSGAGYGIFLGYGFAPTSGTATHSFVLISPNAINQTGGANGITRGLLVSPILTAAADWRSIEWSNNSGWGLYGAGTANNYLAGNIAIGSTSSTTDWLNIAASTTAKAHIYLAAGVAPTSPSNGDIWFDGTDIKMRIGGVTKTFTLI